MIVIIMDFFRAVDLSSGPLRSLPAGGAGVHREQMSETEELLRRDNQSLALQVEALQTQLKEQTRLSKEQLEGLMEDRRVRMDELDARKARDHDKVQMLTEKYVR